MATYYFKGIQFTVRGKHLTSFIITNKSEIIITTTEMPLNFVFKININQKYQNYRM